MELFVHIMFYIFAILGLIGFIELLIFFSLILHDEIKDRK
jgi:hypothetical protein